MFLYEQKEKQIFNFNPNAELFSEVEEKLHGIDMELTTVQRYAKQGFLMYEPKNIEICMKATALQLNFISYLSDFLHQLHGNDVTYLDTAGDDTNESQPVVRKDYKEDKQAYIYQEIYGAFLYNHRESIESLALYEDLCSLTSDQAIIDAIMRLIEQKRNITSFWESVLNELPKINEDFDFGVSYDSKHAYNLLSGNQFDTPNPIFKNEEKE